MARPTSTDQVIDREVSIGNFEVTRVATNAALLKTFATMLDAVTKAGGRSKKEWNGVQLFIPKTDEELNDQLEADQRAWDSAEKLFNRAVAAIEDDDLREWERDQVVRWAEKEGLPNPFDVFAANDPDLAAIREDLGMTV